MNKLLSLITALFIVTSTSVYAEQQEWPFACEQPDLANFGANRYINMISGLNPMILFDTETAQVDKKHHVVKAWTIEIASHVGRQKMIQSLQKYNDYSNYGYSKILRLIDYRDMKMQTLATTEYNCDGTVIYTSNGNGTWHYPAPDSIGEEMILHLKKVFDK